eukprot:TRINITY_DN894_c0_g3_i1.p1 TRINITY_DN894_c0_g3~~TRINITY_DN894_c0_g3_i1.p1  ORF type:complete len:109 (-),score=10.06 TRINITY_DN894_c0_g3_i1:105-431(-)
MLPRHEVPYSITPWSLETRSVSANSCSSSASKVRCNLEKGLDLPFSSDILSEDPQTLSHSATRCNLAEGLDKRLAKLTEPQFPPTGSFPLPTIPPPPLTFSQTKVSTS